MLPCEPPHCMPSQWAPLIVLPSHHCSPGQGSTLPPLESGSNPGWESPCFYLVVTLGGNATLVVANVLTVQSTLPTSMGL